MRWLLPLLIPAGIALWLDRVAAAPLFSDDFNDGTITGWTKLSSGNDMQENGGWFWVTGNLDAHYVVTSGAAWTDYSFTVRIYSEDNDQMGITFRVQDANNYYQLMQGFGDQGGDDLVLQKVVGGVTTDLGPSPITQARARDTWHDLRVDVTGTNIKVWFNSVLQYDINDATFSSGTAGLKVVSMQDNTGFDDVDIQTTSGSADVDEIHYRWRNDDGPEASGGAIAIDGAPTSTTYGSVTSATVGHTVSAGSNRLLLVGVSYNNDDSEVVDSVVWKDGLGDEQSLTRVGAVESVDDARVEIWSLVAPNPGTANVRVTFDNSLAQGGVVGVMSFTGVDQGTPLGTFASNAQQSDSGPASVTVTSAAGELVFDTVACESCTSLTAGGGQTEQWSDANSGDDFGAGSTEPGAASVTMSWTLGSSDHWAIGAVPIKPASGGGGATWAAAEDTKLVGLAKNTPKRIRFEVSNEGSVSSGAITYELQVAETATCSAGSYATVPTSGGSHWRITGSAFLTDGNATTNVSPGLSDEGATFVPGEVKDAGNTTGSISLAASQFTELEFTVQANNGATDGGDYCFRLYDATGGTVLDTYSVHAEVQLAGAAASGTTQSHYRWRNDDGPEAGGGAIAVDGTPSHVTFNSDLTTTVTHTVSPGTDRYLIVAVSYNNDDFEVVTGVTWKDGLGDEQSLTSIGTVSSVDDARVELWGLVAPNTGTADVRVTFDTTTAFGGVIGVASFTGVDQATPLGTFVSNFAQSDSGPATVTASSAPGELVFGAAACESCSSLNLGPGQTSLWNDVNSGRDHGAASTEPGAASVDISWALGSSDHWAIGAVPIKPSGGGGGAAFAAAEDTKLTGLPKLTTRRIRFAVSRASGGGTGAVQYALQMAETATCSSGSYSLVPNTATDHWQIVGSTFISDGEATSNITPGLTDPESTFVAGELKDASNTTGNITLTNGDFTEIEFTVQATNLATDGGDYCFRLYDATNVQVLDAYSVYAEVQLAGAQDVTVTADGTQTATMSIPNINRYVGGKLVISTSSGFRNVTGITVTEGGTVNAQSDLDDIELFWELDTSGPFDGASESYDGTEAQFGVTDTDGFSAANGSSSFTGSVPISPTSSLVVYVLFNVLPTASPGETVEISINNPSSDVSVSSGLVGPGIPVAIPGTTTLAAADGLTQYHYRWRNDDGGEGGTGGTTVDRQVSADSDDAEQRVSSGNMDLGSNLEMVDNEGSLQEVGYRFQNITVPNAAAISNAYIQFTVDDTDSGGVSLTIHGEDIDSAPTFTTSNSNITNRTKTSASVLWSGIPNWTTTGARGPDQRTPDLSPIIQEIVSRPGWNSGQSMVLIFSGSGVRTAVPHDTDPAEAALLHIEHSGGGGGATWGAPEDTKISGVVKNTIQRVRFEISNEGVAGSGPVMYQLQVAEGAACAVGSYTSVPTPATGHWQIVDSTNFADGAPTTNLSPGLTDEASTFVPGEIKDAGNTTGNIALSSDEFTELEFSVQATANAIDGQDYCFRLYNATGGTVLDTYSIYAEAQLAGTTLILADHDAGQEVDKFTTVTPVTSELFAFKLARVGSVTVSDLAVGFTTGGGVASGDVTGGELWIDNNADGGIDAGDTLIQGGVNGSGGQLSFSTNFTPATAGTNYLVRASVSNLVGGDATTFSLATGNITAGGATKTGSAAGVVHTQDAPGLRDVYYSIGTNGADRKTGSPTIAISAGTATFSLAQTGDIGLGDEIDYGAGLHAYIHAVTSQTVFEVRTATGTNPPDTGAVAVNSINRTFGTVAGAISASPGASYLTSSDLVANDVRLTWVAYDDGPFNVASTTTISGYVTDATRYITLTAAGASDVASGSSQRHTGTAGSGARMVATAASLTLLEVSEAYTRVEWLELDANSRSNASGLRVQSGGARTLARNLVIHHTRGNVSTGSGIYIESGASFVEVRNSFIYDYDGDGVHISGDSARIYNTTFYLGNTSPSSQSVQTDTGASGALLENVLAIGPETDFWENDAGSLTLNNCISSDGSADDFMGSGNIVNVDPTAQFVNTAGPIDLHLKTGSDAIDAGLDRSGIFTDDIDAETRFIGAAWDVGADETNALPIFDVFFSVGTSMANLMTGSPNITIAGGMATLDVAQVGNIGVGDRINFGGGTDVYIHRVTSQTELEVRTVTGTVPADAGPSAVNAIGRTFNTWQNAILQTNNASYLNTSDLVTGNFRVTWVGYNDAPFPVSSTIAINGYTTDAARHLTLTAAGASQVASGASQRHRGTEGAGVVFDVQAGTGAVLGIGDGFTRVEWIEIDGNSNLAFGVNVPGGGNDASLEFMLIHDVVGRGFAVSNNNVEIRNCIVHDTGNDGINLNGTGNELYNCTLYMIGAEGVEVAGTATVENVISMNAASGSFHNDGTMTTNNNIASDGSATNPSGGGSELGNVGNLDSRTATDNATPGAGDWVVFENIAGRDFHLKVSAENDAVDAGKDLSGQFNADIDGGGRVAPWDVGADDLLATTAVELIAFEAIALDGAVELRWETGSELNNLGFHVYRSLSASDPYERVTSTVIPGLGNSPVGARYRYPDEGLTNGTTYYYQLEDIETTGVTEMHGPVSATPYAGATLPDDDGPGESPGITYGDPSLNALRVLKRGKRSITLELTTEGFYAVPQEDGSMAIEIPGFTSIGDGETPTLPVKHHWVEAIAGRKVELVSVRGRLESVASGWTVSSETAELVARASGTVQARRRRGRMNARDEGLFPADAARVMTVAFQGESKKALVEMAPMRWAGESGELYLARRLVVRLSFRGIEASERGFGGQRGRRKRHAIRSQGVLARLATTERGLYGVTYEALFGSRGRIGVDELRLSRQGEDVAFHVEPANGMFRRGSTLYFISEGADANPYGHEAVYELQLATNERPGTRMEHGEANAWGSDVSWYWQRDAQEVNQYFQSALVDAPDIWLWDLLLAPVTKSYPFAVSSLASITASGHVEVWVQGTSDTPASPDHHVRLSVNGVFLTEASWNGKQAQKLEAELFPGLLAEGANALELENVGDTDATYSTVMLDRFAVTYPRQVSGALEGAFSESGTATVEGIVIETSETPRWLGQVSRFGVQVNESYLVSQTALTPEVRRPVATTLKDRTNQADYVVLGPRAYVEAAAPLLTHRAEQGLVSKGVAIEDVYAEFGHGESTPEAIRTFLSYAYHEWQGPTLRYVVLLGDGSYDYKDYGQLGQANPVPPLMVKTSYLWTASDPTLAAVNGDDLLPDIAIGRLPAASVDEVTTLVDKILAWESQEYTLDGPAVLVADNPDRAGDFVADAEAAAKRIPTDVNRIYLNELGASATTSSIVNAFDEGASLMSYIGHGGIHLWADENVFNTSKLSTMSPQARQPVLLTMNCLNGYFHFPHFGSLAEELVKAEHKGVIAAFSPSGLSLNTPAQRFHHAMLDELFSGNHRRLGDAVLAAQETYVDSGAFPELLTIYHLFGDPALVLWNGH